MSCAAPQRLPELRGLRNLIQNLSAEVEKVEEGYQRVLNENALIGGAANIRQTTKISYAGFAAPFAALTDQVAEDGSAESKPRRTVQKSVSSVEVAENNTIGRGGSLTLEQSETRSPIKSLDEDQRGGSLALEQCAARSPIKSLDEAIESVENDQTARRSSGIVSLDEVLEGDASILNVNVESTRKNNEALAVSRTSYASISCSTEIEKEGSDADDNRGSVFSRYPSEKLQLSKPSKESSSRRARMRRSTKILEDDFTVSLVQQKIDANLEWQRRAAELQMWFEGLLHKEAEYSEALPSKTIQSLLKSADCHGRTVKWIESVVGKLNEAVELLHAGEVPGMDDIHQHLGSDEARGVLAKKRYRSVIRKGPCQYWQTGNGDAPSNAIAFPSFVELILWGRLEQVLQSEEEKANVLEIREALIIQSVDQIIYEYLNLKVSGEPPKQPLVLMLLDPTIAVVLIINALTLGLSTDISWHGWDICESVFTAIFVMEIMSKVIVTGCREHFCGPDKVWNWFDLTVVGLALFDLLVTFFAQSTGNDMHNFTLARLARLAKITRLMRLIRLLRLRCFKELLLMVKGVVAGMRTLVWAFVLLATLIYILSVMLRQTVGEDQIQVENDPYNTVLFNSIPWSMFNIFRCSISDCTLPNGTPLVAHLYERYGYVFGIPYALVTLFVTFGVFNLIMAVFVENVVESAKTKQKLTQHSERMRICRNLRGLVMRFGGGAPVKPWQPQAPNFMMVIRSRLRALGLFRSGTQVPKSSLGVSFLLGGQISREMFHEVICDEDVHDLMDELQIHSADRSELFDVIDADRSGLVDVSELINGLLKMRSGGADKSDIVATILGIRSLQKQLNTFMENSLENQAMMRHALESALPDHSSSNEILKKDAPSMNAKGTPGMFR